ncbi:MAG: PadR family transcriptional regulator [Micropruina sp.]|nr:MAG: PadR family transcriptional regulator [Micropruina sp.]
MTGTETRLLVLGSVLILEPVNAYQLRRELMTWRVDDWAHMNPGSIYTALRTLAKQGHLVLHEVPERNRTVSVYTSSESGRAEFERLFALAVTTFDQSSHLGLYTALSLSGLVTRERMLELLRRRREVMDELGVEAEKYSHLIDQDHLPPHLPMVNRLWRGLAREETDWLSDTIARIEAGESQFLGEPARCYPQQDDPGWAIARDRQRYLDVLGAAGKDADPS